MKRRYRINKNYLIIGLSIFVLIMSVGYAAFASNLKINGTGSISSVWDIEITGIKSFNDDTTGYNIVEPTYTKTTATFNTGLKSPGDVMVYEIEVSNLGNLMGRLTLASLNCGTNEDIDCDLFIMTDPYTALSEDWYNSALSVNKEINGTGNLNPHTELYSGRKMYLYLEVYLYDDVTSMPDNLTASINLTLNYEQSVPK